MATESRARQAVRLGDTPVDPTFANRQRLLGEANAAEARFRKAVVENWPGAMTAYLSWCAARDAVNAASTEPTFVDVPRFSEVVQQVAYQAAIARRSGW